MSPAEPRPGWLSLWQQALLQPDAQRYLALQTAVSLRLALVWTCLAALASAAAGALQAALLLGALTAKLGPRARAAFEAGAGSGGISLAILYGIFAGAAVWLLLLLTLALQHPAARGLGGSGTARGLLITIAVYNTPLTWLGLLAGWIPGAGQMIGLGLGLYSFYLNIIAVQANYRLRAGRAAAAVILPAAALTLAVGAAAAGSVVIFAPQIRQFILDLPARMFP
jgi:hypothetical protein